MAITAILFDTFSTGRECHIGDTVALSAAGATMGDTYVWNLADRPEGSSASLSSSTDPTPSFTVDKEGSYRVHLVANGTDAFDGGCFVAEIKASIAAGVTIRAPAAGETTEFDSTSGWKTSDNRAFKLLNIATGNSKHITVKVDDAATNGSNRLWYVKGVATLANGDVIPTVGLASAASATTCGAILFNDNNSGPFVNGDIVQMLTNGLVPFSVGISNTLGAGTPIYASDNPGEIRTFGGSDTVPAHIGYTAYTDGGNAFLYFCPVGNGFAAQAPIAAAIVLTDGTVAGSINCTASRQGVGLYRLVLPEEFGALGMVNIFNASDGGYNWTLTQTSNTQIDFFIYKGTVLADPTGESAMVGMIYSNFGIPA